jgi:steroid 5-alpha reductase family enzyme
MLSALLTIFFFMTAGWFAATYWRDNSIVDTIWGIGFILVFAVQIALNLPLNAQKSILFTAVLCWGLRLSAHIGYRHWLRKTEDWRYAAWRKEWGKTVKWRAFLQVFMLQGFFMFIVALPLIFVASHQETVAHPVWVWLRIPGFLLFWFGFLYESIADYQLFSFKKRHPTDIMMHGLWAYSRHPNYFGEILVWWGIYLMGLPYNNGAFLLALASPLTITWLLTRVSGVPMLEKKYIENPIYQRYVHKTPSLFPAIERFWEEGLDEK